jgi:hypothetical protein
MLRFTLLFVLSACASKPSDFGPGNGDPDSDPNGLHASCKADAGLVLETPTDAAFEAYRSEGFTRYAAVTSPDGGQIPIFAQDQVSDAKLLRARNLLRFFLTDVPNSEFGADKSAVANMMVTNGAVLMMPNGAHQEGQEPDLPAQPLYDDETPEDGSSWFMNNNFEHRDAAFEEVFHLVHDAGIGSEGNGALEEYEERLRMEAEMALADRRWGITEDDDVRDWIEELRRENSLAQEYIASVIDSYYGLWGPWEEGEGGMWGIYIAKTRQQVEGMDHPGWVLLRSFLPEYIPTEIRLDANLDQDFSLLFDATNPYTHKSQYFLNVTLQGEANLNLTGNPQDNTLRGNAGDNTLNGGEGQDTAVYCDSLETHTISWEGETLVIAGSAGRDRLESIEWLHFADGLLKASDL